MKGCFFIFFYTAYSVGIILYCFYGGEGGGFRWGYSVWGAGCVQLGLILELGGNDH
jgi:hypothetical protein